MILILGTLAFETIMQLDRLYYEWPEIVVICLFGFLLPSFNIYATTRAMPVGRWILLINAGGVVLIASIIFLPDMAKLYDYAMFLLTSILFVGVASYFLLGCKRTKAYYFAITTGVVTDNRLLKPLFSELFISKTTRLLGSLSEISVMLLALFVFLIFFFLDVLHRQYRQSVHIYHLPSVSCVFKLLAGSKT